jgi:4-alpha-glucanotransferase
MRVLQFAFGGDPKNSDLPHNYRRNTVVYTGTHDNDTTVGWFAETTGSTSTRDVQEIRRERDFCLKYLKSNGSEIHWDFIRAALGSVANIAIIPVQDLVGLGSEARMNLPNSVSGNWTWRLQEGALTGALSARLRDLTSIFGRLSSHT